TALAMASMALLKCMDLPVSVYLTGKGLMISLLKVGLTDWHYGTRPGLLTEGAMKQWEYSWSMLRAPATPLPPAGPYHLAPNCWQQWRNERSNAALPHP
ncbi:hypothetical protein, partial [Halomonas salinarum]|uniref:hypothetical protein n=1 Tax=Halomonas salinarum TaxID=1158993 RepID=UPI001ADE8617